MQTVLIVEDDPAVRASLDRALRRDGYAVSSVGDGQAALDELDRCAPDAIVLDVGLPVIDGIDVCRRLRADGSRTPVLMLTARDAISDRVAGLDAGADDYLVKPFALAELYARLRALLRRSASDDSSALRYRDLTMQRSLMDVRRGPRPIELTRTEYRLLEVLLARPERVVDRATIVDEVGATTSTRRPIRSTCTSGTCVASSRPTAKPASSRPFVGSATHCAIRELPEPAHRSGRRGGGAQRDSRRRRPVRRRERATVRPAGCPARRSIAADRGRRGEARGAVSGRLPGCRRRRRPGVASRSRRRRVGIPGPVGLVGGGRRLGGSRRID